MRRSCKVSIIIEGVVVTHTHVYIIWSAILHCSLFFRWYVFVKGVAPSLIGNGGRYYSSHPFFSIYFFFLVVRVCARVHRAIYVEGILGYWSGAIRADLINRSQPLDKRGKG